MAFVPLCACADDKLRDHAHLLEFELIEPYTVTDRQEIAAIGDYYWMNEVAISDVNASSIIESITSADNYSINDTIVYHPPLRLNATTKDQVNNYRTKQQYVREYVEIYEEGYAPLYLVGRVDTSTGKLVIEEIAE